MFTAGADVDIKMFGGQGSQEADYIALHYAKHLRGLGFGELGNHFGAKALDILPEPIGCVIV